MLVGSWTLPRLGRDIGCLCAAAGMTPGFVSPVCALPLRLGRAGIDSLRPILVGGVGLPFETMWLSPLVLFATDTRTGVPLTPFMLGRDGRPLKLGPRAKGFELVSCSTMALGSFNRLKRGRAKGSSRSWLSFRGPMNGSSDRFDRRRGAAIVLVARAREGLRGNEGAPNLGTEKLGRSGAFALLLILRGRGGSMPGLLEDWASGRAIRSGGSDAGACSGSLNVFRWSKLTPESSGGILEFLASSVSNP